MGGVRYGLAGRWRRKSIPTRGGCDFNRSGGSPGTMVHHAVGPTEIQEMRREMFESYTPSAGRTLTRADRLARQAGFERCRAA